MLSSGNSNAEVTASNLIRISRGEVPYDRIKGIDGSLSDMPAEIIAGDIENDVRETIEEYEPRVDVKDVIISRKDGRIEIEVDIEKAGGQVTEYE